MSSNFALGIDAYHGDGRINWPQVRAAGFSYAWVKVSEGIGSDDPMFATYAANEDAAGEIRGAYHFLHPDQDGAAQANHFLARAKARGLGQLPPAIDVEVTRGCGADTIIQCVHDFNATVKAATGKDCIIYTYGAFWTDNVGNTHTFSDAGLDLWLARYTRAADPGTPPGGWKEWRVWQWGSGDPGSPHQPVSGVPGIPDVNRFQGSHTDLLAWIGQTGTGPVAPAARTPRLIVGVPDGTAEEGTKYSVVPTATFDGNQFLVNESELGGILGVNGATVREPLRDAVTKLGYNVVSIGDHMQDADSRLYFFVAKAP